LKELNIENISENKIKSIISIHNNFQFLEKKQIEIIFFMAKHYFTPIHNIVNLFFPKNLREKIMKNKINLQLNSLKKENLKYNFNFDKQLSDKQEEIFQEINNSKENKYLLH
jgi:primosomal protein N'